MTKEQEAEYLKKLTGLLEECLAEPGTKHGLLIVSDDTSEMLRIFSINADETMLPHLVIAASQVICAGASEQDAKVLN